MNKAATVSNSVLSCSYFMSVDEAALVSNDI